MRSETIRTLTVVSVFAAVLVITSCGGGSSTAPGSPPPPPPPLTTVVITPPVAIVQPGATQQFMAQVSGQIDQTVTWSVPAGEGTITSAGLYTAPSNTGSFSVVATSSVDANSSATANVVVTTAQAGNWQFTGSRQISASLILTNTIITGTAHIFFNLAGCSGFFQPIPLTGTINAQDNISVTSSVVDGSVLSFTGRLSPDHSSISGGTYRFRGGCVDRENGPLTGVQVSQVAGVYSGTMAGGPNGSVTVSALLTQSQSTDVDGFFPVNGTVTVASSACPASFTLYGSVMVGNVIYLYSNTGSGLQGLSGTVDFGATQISLSDYLYLGDCIAGASGTLLLQ
jgi:hypothetical protein